MNEDSEPSPRALIVDDDEALLAIHARALEKHGYRVEMAASAEAALAALRQSSFQVIVSDITMPRMSGIDLLKLMRVEGLDVPVVLVTGQPSLESATEAIEHGVLRYLAKPVSLELLARVVGEAMRLHGLARAKRLALDNEALRSLVDELHRARAAAEVASRARDAFLGKMSHELRTPVAQIIGFGELALDTELTTEQREYMQTILTSANSLLSIIQDVLDYSDLAAGKVVLMGKPFSIREVLGGVVNLLLPRARANNSDLTVTFDPRLPILLSGDPIRLQQIASHLIDNAIKFSSSPAIKVDVNLDAQGETDAVVRTSIADTGVGISKEKLASIRSAFSQGDDSTTRRCGGVGLGLTIACQLTRLMGGELHLESALRLGTTCEFTVRLARMERRVAHDDLRPMP